MAVPLPSKINRSGYPSQSVHQKKSLRPLRYDEQVHDANIVATMQAYDIPALLTHNTKDFERFGQVVRIEGI